MLKATYDPKLADKLRGRSDEYIFENYGIIVDDVTPDVPDLRKIPKRRKLRKRQEKRQRIEKFQFGVEEGLKPPHARLLKHKSWDKVKAHVADFTISKIKSPRRHRKMEWSIWNSNNDYPEFIAKIARENNRWYLDNYDGACQEDSSRFGWAVAHYVYVDGMEVEQVRDLLIPDRFDADFYEDKREELIFG